MKEKISPLHSPYIIDGVRQELTPAQILQSVSDTPVSAPGASSFAPVVDETSDTDPSSPELDARKVEKYFAAMCAVERRFPLQYAGPYTRGLVYSTLLDCIWRLGHFRIGDLCLNACWRWNNSGMGSMAGFYDSVSAVGDMLFSLNLKLREFSLTQTRRAPSLELSADIRPAEDGASLIEEPFSSVNPNMAAARISGSFLPDPKSWIVYIPFDSSSFKLGGSLLAQALGVNPPQAPQLDDTDCFIDCFEVVRELVEDGIVLAGASVWEGGLISALRGMATARTGAVLDLSDLRKACGETDMVSLLFAEVPGVVIQIRDIDFDYIDAELLLQDVAFYPLGHPAANGGAVRVRSSAKTGIQSILESLVRRQGGEGED